jgi:hypothetical protein
MLAGKVIHSRVGSWPYPPTLDWAGKACQGQRSGLLWKVVTYGRKRFYNIGHRALKGAYPSGAADSALF